MRRCKTFNKTVRRKTMLKLQKATPNPQQIDSTTIKRIVKLTARRRHSPMHSAYAKRQVQRKIYPNILFSDRFQYVLCLRERIAYRMSQSTNSKRKLYAILCFLVCIAALAVEVVTVKMFLDARAVKSWPTTTGTVLRSELESTAVPRNFTAHIEYEFALDGQNYRSSSVRTRGTSTKHRSDAMAVLEKFPAGSECTVFYKEGSPDISYLEAGVGTVNYIIVLSPLLFAFMFGAGGWELLKPEPVDTSIKRIKTR